MSDAAETAASPNTPRKPSDKEAMFFLHILGAMKNKPEVDWDLVASRAGYGSANSAKVRFGQIKKAIGFNDDGTVSTTTTPTKARAPRIKKEKTVGSGTNGTPAKVTKKRGTPKKKVFKSAAEVEEDVEADADMNEIPAHEDDLADPFGDEQYE
ncbi:hypothetical protein N431DRAFT_535637 [Stipitochalara longipes BDJ]|nr:hypothetical protein N431DRAFT_535637 [Stipitochalara longipes BDJ]